MPNDRESAPMAGWRRGVERPRNILNHSWLRRLPLPAKPPFLMAGRRAGTARHKAVEMTKITVFLERRGTGCHLSKWRAVGGRSRKRLTSALFATARHFELWRAVPILPGFIEKLRPDFGPNEFKRGLAFQSQIVVAVLFAGALQRLRLGSFPEAALGGFQEALDHGPLGPWVVPAEEILCSLVERI